MGGSQPLISTTSSVQALRNSTDTAVQNIVANAPYLASFSVPRSGAMGAPSELSHHEEEVVVPNDLQALPAMLTGIQSNPYRVAHGTPAASSASASATMSVRKSSADDFKKK